VLRHIKKDHPQVQVIILTAHGSEKDRETGRQLGAFEQLQKPVQIDHLIQTMREAYDRKVLMCEAY
jgi:two-component system response regulator CpxR